MSIEIPERLNILLPIDKLQNLLNKFPPSLYCFAYGSAIFAQENQQSGKLIDLVFIVEDPIQWHTENLNWNPTHYSILKHLGAGVISYLQEHLGTGIYYNTFALVDNQQLKYGVITIESAIEDLSTWKFVYLAGRLHKPILELASSSTAQVSLVKYIESNHEAALRAALLQLPSKSTKIELYYAITELSYIGDSRMVLGEHPNKVQNIVASNIPGFDKIYLPLIKNLAPLVKITDADIIIQPISPPNRFKHLQNLPIHLKEGIVEYYDKCDHERKRFSNPTNNNLDNTLKEISQHPQLAIFLRESLGNIVWKASLRQTATGFLSTGIFGSLKYALEKLKKALFSS